MRSVTQTVDALQAQLLHANEKIEWLRKIVANAQWTRDHFMARCEAAEATVAQQAATIGELREELGRAKQHLLDA